MVYQQTQPGEIKERKHGRVFNAFIDILVMLLVAGATFALFRLTIIRPENREKNNPDVVNKVPTDDEESKWLQQTLNMWSANLPSESRVGVVVYDLDNDSTLGEINSNDVFTEQADSDLALKFSRQFSTAGQTTASELMEIIKAVYAHVGMTNEDFENLKTGLSTLPEGVKASGLRAGFTNCKIYNEKFLNIDEEKNTIAYRDMALLEFLTNDGRERKYAVVALGEGFADQSDFLKLGTEIEEEIIDHFDKE